MTAAENKKSAGFSPSEPADAGQAWSVEVSFNGKEIARIPVAKEKMFIGRMNQNHIVLDNAAVSRSHAMITHTMGKFFVVDQGSQNGTLLNGRVVLQDEWKPGDLLSIGPYLLKLVKGDAKPPVVPKASNSPKSGGEMTLSEHELPKAPKGKKL